MRRSGRVAQKEEDKKSQGSIKAFFTNGTAAKEKSKKAAPAAKAKTSTARIRELDVHKIGRFEGADDSDKAQRTLDGFSFFVMIQDKKKMRERVSSLDEVGELALAHVSADGYVGSDLGEEGSQRSSKLVLLRAIERWTVHYDGPEAAVMVETQQGYYKLLQPAPAYANAWASFQRKVDLTHKIVNLVKREDVCTLPFEEVMKRLVVPDETSVEEGESADKMEVVDLEKDAPANKKGFTEEDVYQHGNWVIDQIQNFLGQMNEQLSNVLLTTPFMARLMEVIDQKAEEEETRKEEEERAEKERTKEKRKRGVDSDDETEDADDPKGKGKAKKGKGEEVERAALSDDDDDAFEEPKHKKRKQAATGGSNGHASVMPSSGFSLLSRTDLDLSKHYAHQETEIEEVKVELIDEFLAAETTQGDEQPWRVLNDFIIYDIADDNRICSLETMLPLVETKKRSKNGFEELRASGTAVPYSDEIDENEDDDDSEDEENDEDEASSEKKEEKKAKQKKQQPGFDIALSTIFYWDIYPDGAVWFRTEYAHYKLGEPSDKYQHIWRPFLQKYQIGKRIMIIMNQDPSIAYDKMIETLRDPYGEFPSFSEKDVVKHIDHIFDEAWGYLDTEDILKFPFFQGLDKMKKGKKGRGKDAARAAHAASEAVRRTAAGKKLERTPATVTPLVGFIARQLFSEKVLREVNMAAELEAEQKLRRMARNKKAALQSSSSSSSSSSGSTPAGGEATDEAGDTCTATIKAASKPKTKPKLPPSEFSWKGESTQTLKIGDKCRVFYESLVRRNAGDAATSAGEWIDLGDFVYIDQAGVRTQDRIKATTVAATDDVDGKACHIYRVIYMCEEQGKKGGTMSVHARRMLKGRETVLQEVGGSEELFLSDICETIVVAHVVRKVNVVFMPPVPQEHPTYDDKETYFYRFYADLETGAFEDARKHEVPPRTDEEKEGLVIDTKHFCHSCFTKRRKEQAAKKRWLNKPIRVDGAKSYYNSFIFNGVTYHQHDFIYLVPNDMKENVRKEGREMPATPYEIHQITKLWSANQTRYVRLRRLFRFGELPRKVRDSLNRDDRELFWSDQEKNVRLDDVPVEGKCLVRHIADIDDLEAYRLDDWHRFFVQTTYDAAAKLVEDLDPAEVELAKDTLASLDAQREKATLVRQKQEPILAMDLFAGCGGFTHGLHACEYIKTTHAVEWVASAVKTFRNNRPDTNVLHGDINALLKHAIERHEEATKTGKKEAMEANQLPPKGAINFIYCGPPCQGFTGMNRFPKADDVLNSLIATTLSCVDFYRPTYFLLENVRGMVDFKLGGVQETKARMSGGIKLGVVKFILRALTAMGYQARFSLQQAGMYGVPQSRRRFFIWGVLRGHTLPQFPQPTHTFPKPGSLSMLLPNVGVRLEPVTARSAPHRYISVSEAISDLPAFEYDEPEEPKDERSRSGPHKDKWIGSEVREYDAEPESDFQKAMRRRTKDKKLYNHVTKTFTEMNVKRICNVPKRPAVGEPYPDNPPFYDHRDLPPSLSPWCLSNPNSKAAKHRMWPGLYGRLDYQGYFQTALTEVCPMGKQGKVLHPYQSRVITVREHARSQGFPDDFRFYAERDNLKDMHRQIGNAVPPRLASALSRQLARAIEQDVDDDDDAPTTSSASSSSSSSSSLSSSA